MCAVRSLFLTFRNFDRWKAHLSARYFCLFLSFLILFFFTGGRHISRLAVSRDPWLLHVKKCRESARAVGKGGGKGGREGEVVESFRAL
jgi:hypothetical protein